MQGSEGAPEAWVEIDPAFADALSGVAEGNEVILLTWLHLGRRDVLEVHPRGDPERPLAGVFATRSPDRPNPIGLHRVQVLETEAPARLRVCPLEAVDGTPVVDIKPVLPSSVDA
jgi:tRNA-Thr(GGU) m(6)t(6)A37 methyltransferase TsaA